VVVVVSKPLYLFFSSALLYSDFLSITSLTVMTGISMHVAMASHFSVTRQLSQRDQ
jgi:hypothetical protein